MNKSKGGGETGVVISNSFAGDQKDIAGKRVSAGVVTHLIGCLPAENVSRVPGRFCRTQKCFGGDIYSSLCSEANNIFFWQVFFYTNQCKNHVRFSGKMNKSETHGLRTADTSGADQREAADTIFTNVLPCSLQHAIGLSPVPQPASVAPSAVPLAEATVPPTPAIFGGVANAVGVAGGFNAHAGASAPAAVGGAVPVATMEGKLVADAIPSDPLLAMHMGAHMALAGEYWY